MAALENWTKWQEEIRAIGVTNPLTNFEANSFGQIDLERSHPGGFSQLVTGRQTLLSNLVRDPLAFSRALSAARRIKTKSDRISSNFGIETIYLVGGLANFEADGFDLNIPILLWPVSLIRKADDYELAIDGEPRVNPALVEALDSCYGIKLNQADLLARQNESSDLIPVTVLNYLANLAGNTANLDLKRILVISNFTTIVSELLADFDKRSTPLIDALTGEPNQGLADIDVPELNLVVDADATQMRIVSRALAGQSFAVETLPGCGYTQTVVNVIAGLVHDGKRVLVVAPRRQTLNEIADRFSAIGLGGLAVRADSTWVDVVAGISRNEKAQPDNVAAIRSERIASENEIDKYFDALNSTDAELGVSISRVLRELSTLSALARPALTSARIPRDKLLAHVDRSNALELLNEAYELGEFKYGPQDTAWHQAVFESPAQVEQVLAIAKNLDEDLFPKLSSQLNEFTQKVNFKSAVTVDDWGTYLRLFVGIRDTLDRFVADVFDRPLNELIAATAPRKGAERNQMSGGNRRRLKKLAKEYLRPGMHVADMHAALKDIQQQREMWQLYCTIPSAPQVPSGINDALVAYQAFVEDLERIQQHLDPESEEPALIKLSIIELKLKLRSLATDTDALANLGDRALVMARLRDAGLGALARDLAKLHTAKEHLALELDQAWWQSALESVVSRDGSVLGYTAHQIAANELRFRAAYEAQIAVGAKTVAHELSMRWKAGLASASAEASALKELLRTRTASVAAVTAAAPALTAATLPAVLVSQFSIPAELPAAAAFDTVLILDAAGTTIAENLPALKRANQVVVFGDDAIAAPTGFEIENRPTPIGREIEVESIFNHVRRVFGAEVLRKSYRTTSQALGDLINREFYQNRIQFVPSAAEYQGERSFVLDLVLEDNRAKTTIEGATESLDAELGRTIELIFNHALWHPQQSLLVASASKVHADRIRAAVVQGLQTRSSLAEFFDSHGREKFEVTPIAELTHRIADRVIFSLGFGRTSHGAVLSNFGQLSEPDGRRYLANLLVSARDQITVVSCFGAEDVPVDRLSGGATILKDLLAATQAQHEPIQQVIDPMLSDLSLRLKKLGARVDDGFSRDLPLIASYAKTSAVIEPDWSIPGQSRTEKFRIRPGLLTSMGWKYVRVYSFELFSDPEAVAIRIAEQLGLQVTKRPLPLFDANDQAFEDTDVAWGDRGDSNDSRLRQDKPPHWG
ncbi:unannotated protein [freshwater metagenome]|uniref:Unannotated protein n=1 Tax=freshwater metagenome TaxID=449393 RepID=A0A6J6GTZ5_9ZZZZ|nr:hypothetical protein [Actinomycetota bacterium]